MQGRFTVRAFDDSHGRRQPSEGTAVSCGIPLTGRRQSGRPSQRRAIPNALPKRANRWTPPDLRPYLSAQTTWGSDAHCPPPAVRTGPTAHPAARQGLAALPPGRPWRTSGSGRGGSDPPVRGPGTGSGRGGDSHLAPSLQGSLPQHQSLAGRPSERRRGTRRINPLLLRLPPLPKLLAPFSLPASARVVAGSGHPQAPRPRHRDPRLPYAAAPVRVSPPGHGDRRFDAAVRLAESWVAPAVRLLRAAHLPLVAARRLGVLGTRPWAVPWPTGCQPSKLCSSIPC